MCFYITHALTPSHCLLSAIPTHEMKRPPRHLNIICMSIFIRTLISPVYHLDLLWCQRTLLPRCDPTIIPPFLFSCTTLPPLYISIRASLTVTSLRVHLTSNYCPSVFWPSFFLNMFFPFLCFIFAQLIFFNCALLIRGHPMIIQAEKP